MAASATMAGSPFAGHEESLGATVEVDSRRCKEYCGSASDFNKGEYKHVEGKRILEPIKGHLADTLREIPEDLQSSIGTAGGSSLADLKKVNRVVQGGENAGEHLFMKRRRPGARDSDDERPRRGTRAEPVRVAKRRLTHPTAHQRAHRDGM